MDYFLSPDAVLKWLSDAVLKWLKYRPYTI